MMEGEGSTVEDLLMGPESFLDEAFEEVDGTNKFALCDNAKAHGQLKNADSLLPRTVSDITTASDSAVKPPAEMVYAPASAECVEKGRCDTSDARAKRRRHKRDLHRQRTARYRAKMANKKLLEKKADILMKGSPFDENILRIESERYRNQLVACGSVDFEQYRQDIAELRLENKVLKFEIKILEKNFRRSGIEKLRDKNDLVVVLAK